MRRLQIHRMRAILGQVRRFAAEIACILILTLDLEIMAIIALKNISANNKHNVQRNYPKFFAFWAFHHSSYND
jgi:hypothetical protein